MTRLTDEELAARIAFSHGVLLDILLEVQDLRAFKAQVERVKACEGCRGIGFDTDPDGLLLGPCSDCGGLPK